MAYNLRELRHDVEDVFATLTGVAEISHGDAPASTEALRPLPSGGALYRSCRFVPPRSAGVYLDPTQRAAARAARTAQRKAAQSPEAREARWRACEATRGPRPDSYYEAKRVRERARYAARKLTSPTACA